MKHKIGLTHWLRLVSALAGVSLLVVACAGQVSTEVPPPTQTPATQVSQPTKIPTQVSEPTKTPTEETPKVIKIGIHALLGGPDSVGSITIFNGAVLAIEQANQQKMLPGYTIEYQMLDDTTPTTGQADPAQAATNARTFIADPTVLFAIGPQFSGLNKATAPLYSQAGMVNISPSATNPDLTNPAFKAEFRPSGKPGFLRVCSTDALQAPGIANYAYNVLNVRKVYIIDDGSAFGMGTADAFEARAKEKGIQILGRDQVDPNAADYSTILTKVAALEPDAIFYGGHTLAGAKLAMQMKSLMPDVFGLSTDGIAGADFVQSAGAAGEGWYVTLAAPYLESIPAAAQFIKDFTARFNTPPVAYSGLSFDAVNTGLSAIKSLIEAGKPLTRENVRDAILGIEYSGITGKISFDENGDRVQKIITIWQTTAAVPEGIKYVADAPQE